MNVLDVILGPTFGKIIDKIFPDPQAKAQAQLAMIQAQQAGEFKELDVQLQRDLAQIQVNNTEAASPDFFRSGWRPLCGYVCVLGLSYQFLFHPLLSWASGIHSWPMPPGLDLGDLFTLLGGMLGLGGLRTAEKFKGVAS